MAAIGREKVLVFMAKGIPFSEETKAEVVNKIKNEGMSVREASLIYDASPKCIYNWLRGEIKNSDRNLILENNRLKKQLEIAERIIGRMTLEVKRGKS